MCVSQTQADGNIKVKKHGHMDRKQLLSARCVLNSSLESNQLISFIHQCGVFKSVPA